MPSDSTRGCIACNVSVRKPALLCSDCDDNYVARYNDDLLVFLREDGPVEVTDYMLAAALHHPSRSPLAAENVERFRAWLRDNAHVDREKVVD